MARVLIIDDNSDMLAMLRMFMERRTAHEVVLSNSGAAGLAQAFRQPPDLALVDIMMPSMDGYEVVRRLRANPSTAGIGIIMLTARVQPIDRVTSLTSGADMHIAKPVNLQELSEAVDTLLARADQPTTVRKMVLPVMSLKGGTGVTTVATNLAVLLQQMTPTVLWDLSPNSGHAALFLGLEPETHWGAYTADPQTPISSLLTNHKSGLQVLCAPPIPWKFGWFHEEQVGAVIQGLLAVATTVVVDVPSVLDPIVKQVLSRSERILLLTGDDPPSMQSTLATLQALQSQQTKALVIHNTPNPGRNASAETLQRIMRVPVRADLPYDPNLGLVLGKGVPLATAKTDSPFVTALKGVMSEHLLRE